ncbi:GPI ethanolamine phosphate transferase 1 [Ophiocordyceps camponoti-floridani]|uniref:GPI ethanolamine phosphate transferase 1 n=1 Tax=Ophiocordyceps camponoti-floridani TaxID=2030778 RepID=A0A8H4Q3K9_9HYPO|nr:GPI ethanolamine phosphate transferase 1 [Ophiocordyceps camponoti-floridani]
MAAVTRFAFLATAIVFHLVYLFSIFDVYFVSPVVSGMRLVSVQRPGFVKAPADRLVLIVGDGLRADKAFLSFPKPYPRSADDLLPRPLAPEDTGKPDFRVTAIRRMIEDGQYDRAIEETDALIDLALEGLRYLQTYDWLFLRALITMGFVGWMAYALTMVIDLYVLLDSPGRKVLFSHVKSGPAALTVVTHAVMFIGTIQALALGYIYREVLTGVFVLLAAWPLSYGSTFWRSHRTSTMKVENVNLILAGGMVITVVGLLSLTHEDLVVSHFSRSILNKHFRAGDVARRTVTGIQIGLVLLAMLVTRSSALSLQAKQGLPPGNQALAWIVLVVSLGLWFGLY